MEEDQGHVRDGAQGHGRNSEEFRILGGTVGGHQAGGPGPHQNVTADCVWDGGDPPAPPPAVSLSNFLKFFNTQQQK